MAAFSPTFAPAARYALPCVDVNTPLSPAPAPPVATFISLLRVTPGHLLRCTGKKTKKQKRLERCGRVRRWRRERKKKEKTRKDAQRGAPRKNGARDDHLHARTSTMRHVSTLTMLLSDRRSTTVRRACSADHVVLLVVNRAQENLSLEKKRGGNKK